MSLRLILTLVTLLVAGCAGQERAIRYYGLEAVPDDHVPHHRQPGGQGPALKLLPLQGASSFATREMRYTKDGIGQERFAWSRWSDSPRSLLQLQLLEGLSRSGLFHAVVPPASPAKGDLALTGTLLDFSLHLENEQPRGVLQIRFLLLDQGRRRPLASHFVAAEVPVREVSPAGAARALNQASRRMLKELEAWLRKELSQGKAAQTGLR